MQTLYAYYQPLTKPLLKTFDTTEININIEGFDKVKISEVTTNSDLCSSFSHKFTSLAESYTYYTVGKKAEIYLRQSQITQITTNGVTEDKVIYTTLFETDPITCTFGLANP